MPSNECIAYYEDGDDLTARTTAAVTGKRFLMISGDRTSPAASGLTNTVDGGVIQVAHATAAGRIVGVSSYDAASGAFVGVMRGNARVLPVTAAGNLTAFQEVEVGTNGQAVAKASGVAVGYALTACASGADAQISLY